MSISCPTCQHLHPTGRRCGSPALRGEQFCFFHHPTRRPPARTPTRTPFDLPPITDPEELQIALSEVIRRLADNTLDLKRASLLLHSLQIAKANLPAMPAYPPQPYYPRAAQSPTAESPSRPPQSTGSPHQVPDLPDLPDFSDLSGLLSGLSPHPTPTPAKL